MTSILEEGKNCWKVARAKRFALLVDAEDYFSALYSSLLQARRCTLLSGWDFHSRTALMRNEDGPVEDSRLRKVLDRAAEESPDLQTYVVAWDYAMLYALEREPMSVFNFAWRSHSRVHFTMDGQHPVGASHHQKIAVLDDVVGYTGGIDITQRRWDTSEHLPEDPRRVDPSGESYGPFHDLQAVVEGEPAYWLGQFVRDRWLQATGKQATPSAPPLSEILSGSSPWPEGVEPILKDVTVGVARTSPRFKQREAVQEIERLYVDAIGTAKRSIYIESQYLAAAKVVDALAERLGGESPPEVVIVLPLHCTGWLEEQVMNTLRVQAVQTLSKVDKHGRCRLFYPGADSSGEHTIKVHAKCMMVDDAFFTVGSANLSNRSMGLDTECNLAVEAENENSRKSLASLRARLLADHLGADPEHIRAGLEEHGSMLRVIEANNGDRRRLLPLEEKLDLSSQELPMDMVRSLDPEKPIALDSFLDEVIEDRRILGRGFVQLAFAALVLLGLSALIFWRVSPWGGADLVYFLDFTARSLRAWPYASYVFILAFIAAGILPVPILLLTAATTLVYAPGRTFLYMVTGTLLGASVGYFAGRMLGNETIRRIVGSGLNSLSRYLAKGGLVSVLLARLVPLMPFSMVNIVAGSSRVRFHQFILGTIFGLAPVMLAVTVIAEGLREMLLEPAWVTTTLLLGSGIAILLAMLLLRQRLEPAKSNSNTGHKSGERSD